MFLGLIVNDFFVAEMLKKYFGVFSIFNQISNLKRKFNKMVNFYSVRSFGYKYFLNWFALLQQSKIICNVETIGIYLNCLI